MMTDVAMVVDYFPGTRAPGFLLSRARVLTRPVWTRGLSGEKTA
jgi:hypothetical protein